MSRESIIKVLLEIQRLLNNEVVFTGGVLEYLIGTKNYLKDIDIVINKVPIGLTSLSPVMAYNSNTRSTVKVKIDGTDKLIDCHISNQEFPEHFILENLNVITPQALIDYHVKFGDRYREEKTKEKSKETIRRLREYIDSVPIAD